MDTAHTLLALTFAMAASVISPGPNFALVASTATSSSRRDGMHTALGLSAASVTWALLAIFGVGLIFTYASWLATAIRIAGALYLIWLGFNMLLGARQPLKVTTAAPDSSWSAARKAFLVSMTNPKSVAFYASIFSVMVPHDAPAWMDAAIVAIAGAVSLTWYGAVALLLSRPAVRAGFLRRKVWIESVLGVCLMGLGGRLLASR